MEFSRKTFESIGIYVYCLVDPRNRKIFYVGKGKGNRVFHHAKGISEIDSVSEKIELIHQILNSGGEIEYYIIRHGIENDYVAFEIEASIIDTLDFCGNNLSNIVSGHHTWDRGLKTITEVEAQYSAEEIYLSDIYDELLVININKNYKKNHSSLQATEGDWKINPYRANKAKYIIAEYHGIWREIYTHDGWVKCPEYETPRYKTKLTQIEDSVILSKYLNKYFLKKQGSQNPIRYINI